MELVEDVVPVAMSVGVGATKPSDEISVNEIETKESAAKVELTCDVKWGCVGWATLVPKIADVGAAEVGSSAKTSIENHGRVNQG